MRIGIDARFYGSVGKGLGRYTEKLVLELEKIDTENEYVIFLSQENFDEYQPKSSNFSKVLSKSRWYSFGEQCFFPFLLMKARLDVVHFPHFNVPLLYRRTFIMTLHDLILFHYPTTKATTRMAWLYWFKFYMYRLVLKSALMRARKVITVSDFTKADITKNYPRIAHKIAVTKEAAEPFCYYSGEQPAHGILKPYLLYVGNAYPHKNLDVFVRVAARFPEYQFVLVGKEDFFYRKIKEVVEQAKIPNIFFVGYVSDRELGALYRHAEAYIFPSFYEGFGLPPLEAMQYGVPVLASDRGSLPEVLGDAAAYFDPTSDESICQTIQEVLVSEDRKLQLQAKGYAQAGKYSWSRMARETWKEYQKQR